MPITFFQIDAFAAEPFKGNPAAVCLLDEPRPDRWMQQVASEMNLSETAFLTQREGGGFGLRWFTPTVEVPLCGHATLASAHALWESGKVKETDAARFHTHSGELSARRAGSRIELDFPSIPVAEASIPEEALAALGVEPLSVWRTPDLGLKDANYLLELRAEEDVRGARPDFAALGRATDAGVIITARAATAGSYDFVSRYFATFAGIDEDPVTGAAHCSLAPYWCRRLGQTQLVGYQASARGGFVHVRLGEGRVYLSGEAVTVLRGMLLA
ncbi:MAG: PhzF family phenazine biosynthesis protein [Pyrinomonadaceae bacterium]